MPFVPVPKDLTKVKTKVALNLTKRQLICFSIAGTIGVPTYLFTKDHIGTDIAAVLMVFIMLPLFFVALYEKNGLTFEKIARHYIRQRFLLPKKRKYRTTNFYNAVEKQSKLNKEVLAIVQSKKVKKKK
ncbi:PrgI family protein [Enterococcus plantarum]|uniref:PrgI family protein n=1 Tax=Enterococcus plantarum TaxID=1077675 RepID=UPI001A906DA7|nr:PrgI family protein [Enterococcus plantarum]MBO0468560.1 PrgI family protein [Enterococcus plantarum]